MNPYDSFTLINAGKAVYAALPENLREENDRGAQAHIAARAEAERFAQERRELTQLKSHLCAAIDQSSMIRTGFVTKEEADRAALLTGGILAGGVLIILGGLVWKAVSKSDFSAGAQASDVKGGFS
jgi:hypothetical protein